MSVFNHLNANNWIKTGVAATDDHGKIVRAEDAKACKFCVMGAYWRWIKHWKDWSTIDETKVKAASRLILERYPDRVTNESYTQNVFEFNDRPDTTFSELQTLFQKAGF